MPDNRGEPKSPPGFRFSTTDAATIIVISVAVFGLWRISPLVALMPPIVLGHFFLFCNVFRIRRSYELLWSAVFVINLSVWWTTGTFSWLSVLLVQSPVTLACVTFEMMGSRYHGIGYAWIQSVRRD